MASRWFLGLSAAVWLPYGLFCLIQPSFLQGAAGVVATSATGTAELRAMYGGLQAAIGVLCVLGCVSESWRRHAVVCLGVLAAGLGLGRLAALAVAGGVSTYSLSVLLFEFATASVALALTRREPESAGP